MLMKFLHAFFNSMIQFPTQQIFDKDCKSLPTVLPEITHRHSTSSVIKKHVHQKQTVIYLFAAFHLKQLTVQLKL